jgi:hypothetical protein
LGRVQRTPCSKGAALWVAFFCQFRAKPIVLRSIFKISDLLSSAYHQEHNKTHHYCQLPLSSPTYNVSFPIAKDEQYHSMSGNDVRAIRLSTNKISFIISNQLYTLQFPEFQS